MIKIYEKILRIQLLQNRGDKKKMRGEEMLKLGYNTKWKVMRNCK